MNDWFSFEQSPWEMAAEKLRRGDTMDAVRLLTLLENRIYAISASVMKTTT